MPEEEKKTVDIDTSGPDVDIDLPEEKKEETGGIADIQVEETESKSDTADTDKTYENERETKLEKGGEVKPKEEKQEDDKLETAVTGKVKPGSKAAKRRKSYCARSLGQLKRASAKTRNDPNSRIRQARRRWKC